MLTDILNRIDTTKELASTEVDQVLHIKTYHTRIANKNRAAEQLEELFMEYKNKLRGMILFIVTAGNGTNKFSEMCETNNWAFTYNTVEFYKELLKEVDPINWKNKAFGPSMIDVLANAIEGKADECDIVQYNQLVFKNGYDKTINTENELLLHISKIFNEQIGVEFMAYDILNKMSIKGIEDRFDGVDLPVLPVIIKVGENYDLVKDIMSNFSMVSKNTFLVTTGVGVPREISDMATVKVTKIEKETIIEALKTINSKR